METPKIIDFAEYREQITQQTQTSQTSITVCSEDLATAIRELIQRLRDHNPIEHAMG